MTALPPERVAELEKSHGPRQTGGNPVGFDPNDHVMMLNVVREHGEQWLKNIDQGITELEGAVRDQRRLRDYIEAMWRGAKG